MDEEEYPVLKKNKVLIYYNSMNASGGVERVIANLVRNWMENYDITILVKDDGKSFYPLPNGIVIDSLSIDCSMNMNNRVSRALNVFKGCFSSVAKLKEYLKNHECDWIYTATPMQCFEVVRAGYGKKVIATEHASAGAYNKVYQRIKDYAYKRVYKVT